MTAARTGAWRLEQQRSAAKQAGVLRAVPTARKVARECPSALSPADPAAGPRLREWLKEAQSHGSPLLVPSLTEPSRPLRPPVLRAGSRAALPPLPASRGLESGPASREREQCGGQRSALLNSLSRVLRRRARPSRSLEGPRARALQSESLCAPEGRPCSRQDPQTRERLWRTGTRRRELPARPWPHSWGDPG